MVYRFTHKSSNNAHGCQARLTALGHSAPGMTFDIDVWVQVDGISSAQFPVFINTPWTHIQTMPIPTSSCSTLFPGEGVPNGWVGRVDNSIQDLTNAIITPIDARETFENNKIIYSGTTWIGSPTETTWTSAIWQQNTFADVYAMCWGGSPTPNPPTTSWSLSGSTAINSDTQKYWIGSFFRFQGKCSERKAVTWYTDHIVHNNFTTPIADDSSNGPCAQGRFAN